MTDRQRFENNAIANGVKVLESTDTVLKILATNGKMITTYTFDDCGNFKTISTEN